MSASTSAPPPSLPAPSRAPSALLVLDWGIGGLDTLQKLRERCPSLPLIYLSDAGFTPYGKVPHAELGERLERLCERLAQAHELMGLMVACNAASSALTPELRLPPTLSVIEQGVEASLEGLAGLIRGGSLKAGAPLVLGVVGGEATIRSGLYERELLRRRAELDVEGLDVERLEVRGVVAQPISAHVEAGRLSGASLHADLHAICHQLQGAHALTLACTHYPAISEAWRAHLPNVALIDPVERFVSEGVRRWGGGSCTDKRDQEAPLTIYTTGSAEALVTGARLAWGLKLTRPVISLDPHSLRSADL